MNIDEENGSLSPSDNEVCDYCHQKKVNNLSETQYYHFGFKRRRVTICQECFREKDDYSPLQFLVSALGPDKVYLEICHFVRSKSTAEKQPINFYEAVQAAYLNHQATADYINKRKKIRDFKDIDKNLRSLWKYVYRIVNGFDMRIKAAKADPDSLLVFWMED